MRDFPEWKRLVAAVKAGIQYLRNRLAGPPHCQAPYDCSQVYEAYRLLQAFDPSHAATHTIDGAFIDGMKIIPAIAPLVTGLKQELPAYLALCAGAAYDHEDVSIFTASVLGWWKDHGSSIPTWSKAMQIIGSFNVNSAAAERVFSALKRMFGDAQMTTDALRLHSSGFYAFHQ